LNDDLLILLIGAIIGVLASLLGYYINYLLRMREVSISREFEMYQKGMSYLQNLYGFLSVLFDLVDGYVRAVEKGKAQVSDASGFIYLAPKQIVTRYKTKYEEFSKFMGEEKNKGSEVFLRKDLAQDVTQFWALASYFYEKGKWDKHLADKFDDATVKAMERIEEMLGITRRPLLKRPKWLNPREIRTIFRGNKTV